MTDLEPGQTALLRLRGAAAVAARIDAVDDDAATLILLTPPLRPPGNGQPAEVEVTTRRGIVRLPVRVLDHDGRGSVRVAADPAAAGRRQTIQRRDFVRVDATVPVVVRAGGPAGDAREVYSLNVSGGGLLLSGLSHLQVGDYAWVAMDLEDGTAPVEALVVVAREADRGARGVHIVSISARDEQRIVRFAFARERRARLVRST